MKGAKPRRAVVQAPRLSDQVYQLLKEDLMGKVFTPGQRLVELDLAERYGVSRTPIREAMARLSREEMLTAKERGYLVPLDAQRDVLDRLEVRRLLDAQVARRAARVAEPEHLETLLELYQQECAAHSNDDFQAFIEAHQEFRASLRELSGNNLLNRCAVMVDDSFQLVRNQIHEDKDNREMTIRCDGDIVEAIKAGDEEAAAAAVEHFIDMLLGYFGTDK